MGKRNKASKKQKKAQAKSASKLNSKKLNGSSGFGIIVSKGKHGKGQRQAGQKNNMLPSSLSGITTKSNNNTIMTRKSGVEKEKLKQIGKKFKMNRKGWNKPMASKITTNIEGLQENEDFAKELASLHERQYHQELRKRNQRKRTNNKQSLHTKSVNLTPAILQIKPKTTEDLINDTADRVAVKLGMGDPFQTTHPFQHSSQSQPVTQWSSNQLQILAAQKRLQWESEDNSNPQEKSDWDVDVNDNEAGNMNPFAALGNGDDDSVNETNKPEEPPPMLFHFAPASFSLPSASNNNITNDLSDL